MKRLGQDSFLPGRRTREQARERAKGLKGIVLGGPRGGSWPRCEPSTFRNAEITDPARCNENSLRLVTSRDSRIKFSTDARLYFQTGWSSHMHLKAIFSSNIFSYVRSKAPSWSAVARCLRNKWLDQIKRPRIFDKKGTGRVHRNFVRKRTSRANSFEDIRDIYHPSSIERNVVKKANCFKLVKLKINQSIN